LDQTYRDDYHTMNLEIREDGDGKVFVKDLSLIPLTTVEEVMAVVSLGLRLRATHETKINQVGISRWCAPLSLPLTFPPSFSLVPAVRCRPALTRCSR